MSAHLTIVGSVNFDLVVSAPRLVREGENLPVNGLQNFAGGKGANRAVAAQRLGAHAGLVGAVGNDLFGAFLKEALGKNAIDLQFLKTDPVRPTGMAFITLLPTGNNTIVADQGANFGLLPCDIEAVEHQVAASDGMIVDLEIPLETVEAALGLAKKHSKLCVLDAGPARDCPFSVLQRADIVSPNETELEKLSGMPVTDWHTARQAGEHLLKQGVRQLVLKLGRNGALWMKGTQWQHFPAVPVTAIDPTAAGDAFTTALTIQLLSGQTMDAAIRYANVAGALTTTKKGAMPSLPTQQEITAFLARSR